MGRLSAGVDHVAGRHQAPPRGLGVHRLQRIREAAGPGDPDYPADGAVDGAG